MGRLCSVVLQVSGLQPTFVLEEIRVRRYRSEDAGVNCDS